MWILDSLPPPSASSLLLSLIVVFLVWCLAHAGYNYFISPLSKVPAPLTAHLGDYWLLWQGVRFNRCFAVDESFKAYGPIVRIASNKVAVNAVDDIQEIYRGHNYRKSDWYEGFTFDGLHNNFSTDDPKLHAFLNKWSAPPFRKENLIKGEAAARRILDQFTRRVKLSGPKLETVSLFRLLALDMMGAIVLGCDFRQVETGQTHPCVSDIDRFMIDKQLCSYLPGWLYWTLRQIPLKPLRNVFESGPRFLKYAAELYDDAVADDDSEQLNILSNLKNFVDPKTGESPPEKLVISQAAAFLFAGADTTTVSLVYICWEIARTPRVYTILRAALEEAIPDPDTIPGAQELKDIPYLAAVIKEGLRVWAPGQSMLERVVPAGGAVHQGIFLPAGTIIAGQAWSSHRRETTFPDPLVFRPERWLKEIDGKQAVYEDADMLATYWPFGIGLRGCIGRPLAEMELYMIIATIVRRFKIKPAAGTNETTMRPRDVFMLRPSSGMCEIEFEECV
ncbi:cytochrome P450 [Roridomyces roridus]|uniref:Cytochrome P450 n=1 Tax=Roridomyces roridus TaxID=1738132 RepID=A0AAD7CMB7_9AGAR|nr:cytochrome P450 [Roridomyces roridus]